MAKGFLKAETGLFQLAPKVTTIGREGCDLVIQSPGVDFQHALIEYADEEKCFVLQDLNSAHGTFVNDCRVQNAAVRLAPGDMLRFGCTNITYTLEVDAATSQVTYPPVHQRMAWSQPLTIINESTGTMETREQPLPHLQSAPVQTMWGTPQGQTLPRPPPPMTIRSRPLSAGSAGLATVNAPGGTRRVVQDDRSITGYGRSMTSRGSPPAMVATIDATAIQEKEQEISRLSGEVGRLSGVVQEMQHQVSDKEIMVQRLRAEVQDLQVRMRQYQTSPSTNQVNASLQEVERRALEVQSLKQQIEKMKEEAAAASNTSYSSRQEVNDRIQEANSLRVELERVRKDKNITAGLVTTMQRDMANKDTTISRLTRELENLKQEIKEKDVQLTSMQSKFKRVQDNRKTEEEFEAKEKELAGLRQRFKATENRMQEQAEMIKSLNEESEKTKQQLALEKENIKKMKTELEGSQSQYQDVQRTERQVRVDLEQLSKQMERFRARVLQVAFSTPGIRAPSGEIGDDELLETLKKLVDERTELTRQLGDTKESLTLATAGRKDSQEHARKLKQQVTESLERLQEGGHLSQKLRQEVDFLSAVSVDETLVDLKEVLLQMLQAEMAWQTDIETALESCGINVKLSDDSPSKHILALKEQYLELCGEKDALTERLSTMEEQHQADLQTALDNLRQELQAAAADDIQKANLENDEKMNAAIDEIRAIEAEKRENCIQAEKQRITELEAAVEQLKTSILEKEEEDQVNRENTQTALQQLEAAQKLELELREQINVLEKSKVEEVEKLQRTVADGEARVDSETATYKEQIKQHSVTICAMEERLNKLLKKNKDYQAEINTLKATVADLKAQPKPSAPPKPKVILQKPAQDIVAMEQLIVQLRRENAELQKQVNEQQDVVVALRRDLSGASARLSDIKGELSESQKQELEQNRRKVMEQEGELLELRQQMAKLSQIVDKQTAEVKDLNADLNKQKSALGRYKSQAGEQEVRVKELEETLQKEQEEAKKHIDLMAEEGRITSELTALGSQCRGERHEQIITRQREALAELRGRIRTLEQTHPPIPNHDQALQQVILLKKELAELRAQQALSEDKALSNSILEQQVSKARGIEPQSRADADIERSAHRETMESLELSENSFLILLRAMASSLEMDDVGGLRSMAHIPKDERARLFSDREQASEILASRVKVLKERIARKDELLQGYERDLAKLRQAETLADHKASQVEALANEIRGKSEEAQLLRESLNRTREKLDQEKRFNSAIKLKKAVQTDGRGWRKHQCPPEDYTGKMAAKKKEKSEALKRRNYEIRTLKTELSTRERELDATQKRLEHLESSYGIQDSAREIETA